MIFTPRFRNISLWLCRLAALAFVIGFCLWLALAASGCASAPSGSPTWHVWAPTTWPIFSGAHTVNKAAAAEAKVDDSLAKVRQATDEAAHAAHLEFFKLSLTLQGMAQSKALDLARRFSANGLGLMEQFDPLTAVEAATARSVVADFLSDSATRVATAEHAQTSAEQTNTALSAKLDDEMKRANANEVAARQANVSARAAAMENIDLANELRSFRWLAFWLLLAVVLGGLLLAYVRTQLGGVGAALHEIGAPASMLTAINTKTSALGQWFMRTGREAAAKAEAVLKISSPT